MAAKIAGADQIIAVDRHASRLELATKYGATATYNGDVSGLTATIQQLTDGGSDYAFDTTGNAAVVRATVAPSTTSARRRSPGSGSVNCRSTSCR